MEIVATHTNVIVPGVLRRGNYKRWSIFMRHYLLGQDLWDVVQSSQSPAGGNMKREWIKKNALALHAIKISCGEEIFDQIKEKDSAKDVWDALADMSKPPVVHHERRTGPGNLGSLQYETLTNAISNGELGPLLTFFRENSNPRSAIICENGYTALHFAVYSGRSEIVDYLIKYRLSKEDLETKDDSGSTALSIAARYGVGKSIAQKLVGKNYNLLTIEDNDGKIPVELACTTIQEDLIRYLYRETPLESLNVNNGVRILRILQECITRKMFDIVFDLLHHFPELASRNCSLDSIPLILILAQTPPPFFKRSNLSFWGRSIYNCIILAADVIKKDKHRSCAEKQDHCFEFRGESFQEAIQDNQESAQAWSRPIQETNQDTNEETNQDTNEETNQDTNQDTNEETNEETNQDTNQELQESSLTKLDKVGFIISVIIALTFGVPFFLFVILPPFLVRLITGALRQLVSILSRCFGTDVYKTKLMDEYARKVIRLICHQTLSELDQNQFVQSRAVEATFYAIKNGIPDIVEEITKANANILWSSTDPEDSRSRIQKLFALAVKHRQEEVAHLFYESEKEKNMLFTIDEDGNNTLHLAAKLPPNYQLGYIHAAALQLQSEIRWFKAVKEIVPGAYKKGKNTNNETPLEVFVREHKQLLKEAEEWVKKTAESSTVVGAFIITIMFAVAFTAPGGNDQSTGLPVLLHKAPTPFMIFMVSDAISLFTATSSVLMFLGILTSHHSDEDYRKSFLLIIGLTSLFVSVATMTTAFCAALFIMLQGQGGLGLVIPITLLAVIPIVCYVSLQFPLLVEIMGLTFSSNIFGKKGTFRMSRITADMIAFGKRGLS